MNNDNNYDKVKHLVKIDNNISAVFIVESSQIKDLYIAKNADIDKTFIESIFKLLDTDLKSKERKKIDSNKNSVLGELLWDVSEYNKLRILKIYEKDKIIIVLIKSYIQVHRSVDNILAYYFEIDEMPKSLF